MKNAILIVCVVVMGLGSAAMAKVTIETVPVGNVGNIGEWSGQSYGGTGPNRICGAVDYAYEIGKYEVTAGQYTEFLNAVAKTDPYGLYNSGMESSVWGCQITQNGTSGNYTYDFSGGTLEAPGSTAADWQDRPVNYINWGDAARFANWLYNGQPMGAQDANSTEDGAYDLSTTQQYYGPNGETPGAGSGYFPLGDALAAVTRKDNATWVIPSEDEWYKAAYHKNDGVAGEYYDYPTGSDSEPSNDLDLGGDNATFKIGNSDFTIGSPYYRTQIGAHENSGSPYGTFDQAGNVFEWNEMTVIHPSGLYSIYRGGSFTHYGGPNLRASSRYLQNPPYESFITGFRVAKVPEPATLSLLTLGGLAMLRRKRRACK